MASTLTQTWASSAPMPVNWPLAAPLLLGMKRQPMFTGKTKVLAAYYGVVSWRSAGGFEPPDW